MSPLPRQGWLLLIKFLKWYFLKYWQVRTRPVFAQTVTYDRSADLLSQKQESIIHSWYNVAGVTGINYCPDYYSSYLRVWYNVASIAIASVTSTNYYPNTHLIMLVVST